jgi:tetratricopeptide (TPR) repeat protein
LGRLRPGTGGAARRVAAALLACWLGVADASAQTVDRVRRRTGVDSGKVTSVNPLGAALSRNGVETVIPAEEIVSISFAGEPSQLSAARTAVLARRYDEALAQLAAVPTDGLRREELLAEVQFYAALAAARQAQTGAGDLAAAVNGVQAFMKNHRGSFHLPAAIELLGDLYGAQGQFEEARKQYALLARAKSPYFELRSALLVGRSWEAAGDAAAAVREYDKVLAADSAGPLVAALQLEARLARAVGQAQVGQAEQAVGEVAAIIAAADNDDDDLLAQAYLTLGDCYLKSGDKKAALFAYLHVELLFPNDRQARDRATTALATLWQELGYPDRAQQARQATTPRNRAAATP